MIQAENPEATPKELDKLLAKAWRETASEVKRYYQEIAASAAVPSQLLGSSGVAPGLSSSQVFVPQTEDEQSSEDEGSARPVLDASKPRTRVATVDWCSYLTLVCLQKLKKGGAPVESAPSSQGWCLLSGSSDSLPARL